MTRARSCAAFVCAGILLTTAVAFAGLPEAVYTLRELLERSTIIAVGSVAKPDDAGVKTLAAGTLELRDVLKGDIKPGRHPFRVIGPPLPVGAKAIWFLRTPGRDGVFVIDHPQCAYDVTHRTLLEAAMRRPERIRPGYYLRREDEHLAKMVREAKERAGLRKATPGAPVGGLSVAVEVVRSSPRAGKGIIIEYTLTNVSDKPLLVCDSAQECYFARMRRPGPTRGTDRSDVVARAGAVELDVELAIDFGQLISEHDFVSLAPAKALKRKLSLSTKKFRALMVPGRLQLWGIYRYAPPDPPLVNLPSDPWSGVAASVPVDVMLQPPLQRRQDGAARP